KLAAADPKYTNYRAALAIGNANLGALLTKTGQAARALPYFEQARSLQEKLVQDDPKEADFRSWLGKTWDGIGQVQAQLGHRAEAVAAFRTAIEKQRSAL